jgi:hypothetical protein
LFGSYQKFEFASHMCWDGQILIKLSTWPK